MSQRLASLLLALVLVVACGTVKTADPVTTPSPVTASTAAVVTTASGSSPPSSPSPTSNNAAGLTQLDDAEALWKAQGLDGYSFTIRRECYCLPDHLGPFEVVVSDGIPSVTAGGVVADPAALDGLPLTAEQLFAFLRLHVADKDYRASFDPASGFPLSFYSDPVPAAADDELGLEVAAFEAR